MARSRASAFLACVLVLAVGAVLGAGSASGTAVVGPQPGSPDPKQVVLRSSDLGAARVALQRYSRSSDFPGAIAYEREFRAGKAGGARLLYAASAAEVGTDAPAAARVLAAVHRALGSKKARAALAKGFAQGVGDSSIPISKLQVGHVRALGAGLGSFDLPMSVRILGLRTDLHIALFRVDRLLGALELVGAPGARVPVATMTRLARVMTARMAAELVTQNLTPPAISGPAQSGQMLTAGPGTWSGATSTFTYRWQRCDGTGANCADLPGAVDATYALQDADVGSTLRVVVTATNAFGEASAESAPTAIVTPAPAPLP